MKLHKMSDTHDPTSLCWYYDNEALHKTPSIQDGISFKTECRYRKEGARLIIDAGGKMELGYNTVATGVVFFHRFYMFYSFKTFPRYVTACSCLFLAGKVEETPKKCKDIVKAAQELIGEKKLKCFGDDPKEDVMTLEKIILQTIKFDLKVKHPYNYLTRYAKSLKGNSHKLQRMVQMAWIFINDSLCTTLPLQWEPEIIAIAVMYLAGKLCKFSVQTWHSRKPEHKYWWDLFVEDLKLEVIEDICHQVLDVYAPFQNNTSPRKKPAPETYTPPLKKQKPLALQTSLQPESQILLQNTSLTPQCTQQIISLSPATLFALQSTPYLISPAMSQSILQPVSKDLHQPLIEPVDTKVPVPNSNINSVLSPRDPRLNESVSALASDRLLTNNSLNQTPSTTAALWHPSTLSSSTLSHTNACNSPICCSKSTRYVDPVRTLGESISDEFFRGPFNNGNSQSIQNQCCCSQNKIDNNFLLNCAGKLNDDCDNQLIGCQRSFDSFHKNDSNVSSNSPYFKSQNDYNRNSWKVSEGFGKFNNNYDGNRPTSGKGFGNHDNNDNNGNQSTYRKGFGDSYNNDRKPSMNRQSFDNLNTNDDGNRPMYRKGFGSLDNNDDGNRPMYRKGFGKSFEDDGNSSMKSRGFGKPWMRNGSFGRFGNNGNSRFAHRKDSGSYNNNEGNTFGSRNGRDTNSWSKNKGFGDSNDHSPGFKHSKGFGNFNSSDDLQQSDTKRFHRFDSKFAHNKTFNNSNDYEPKSSKGFENSNRSNWSRPQTRGRGFKRFSPYSDNRSDECSWGKSQKSFNNNDKPVEEESWDESPKQPVHKQNESSWGKGQKSFNNNDKPVEEESWDDSPKQLIHKRNESSWGKGPKSFNNNDKPIEEESWDESPKQSRDKLKQESSLGEGRKSFNNNYKLIKEESWDESPKQSHDKDKSSNEPEWDKIVEHSNNNNIKSNRMFPLNKSPSRQPKSLDTDKTTEESWD